MKCPVADLAKLFRLGRNNADEITLLLVRPGFGCTRNDSFPILGIRKRSNGLANLPRWKRPARFHLRQAQSSVKAELDL